MWKTKGWGGGGWGGGGRGAGIGGVTWDVNPESKSEGSKRERTEQGCSCSALKGKPKRRRNLPCKCRKSANVIFHWEASLACSINMYTKDTPPPPTLSLSFFEFELPSVQSSVVCLFALSPMKSTEKFSRDTFDTFAIHSGLIRHVTSRHVTDRLLGAKMAVRTCFHDLLLLLNVDF